MYHKLFCYYIHSFCDTTSRLLIIVLQKLILELSWQLVQEQNLIPVIHYIATYSFESSRYRCMPIYLNHYSFCWYLFFYVVLAAWWQQHGICCLELQRIAVRILSQTCSSIGCEHNWSIFDQMYNLRSNHLSQNRSNDLMYVHYNLRLRELQVRRGNSSISLDNSLLEHLLKDWIVDTGRTNFPENEVLHASIWLIPQSDIITQFELDCCEDMVAKESLIFSESIPLSSFVGSSI